MNLTFVWIKNGVFGGKTCRGFRVIGVNFHICWKRACVKDLTNIMSACRLPGCSTGEKIQKWPKISRWAPPYQYVHQVVPHSKWGKGPKGSLTTCPLIHCDLSTAPCPLFSFNTLGLWLLHVKKWTFLCHWYYRVKFLVPFPIIKEWTFLCHFQLLKSELSCTAPIYQKVNFLLPLPIIKKWTFLCHSQLLKSEVSCATPNY